MLLLLLVLFGKTFLSSPKIARGKIWEYEWDPCAVQKIVSVSMESSRSCSHAGGVGEGVTQLDRQLLFCMPHRRLFKMNAWKNHFNVWMPIGDGGQPLWALVNALRIYMIHIHLHIHIRLGNPAQPRGIQRHNCWAWIMGLSREVVVSICCSMGTLCVCWARVKTMCDTIWIFDYFSGVHTSCIIHQLIAPHLGLQKIEANRWGDQTIIL